MSNSDESNLGQGNLGEGYLAQGNLGQGNLGQGNLGEDNQDESNPDESPLLEFVGVRLGYGRAVILDGLDFHIRRGEFLGIVGPNGSGKTTLLRAILGTLRPLSGEIRKSTVVVGKRSAASNAERLRFGYVPQREYVNEMFPLTVEDIVLMGRYPLVGLLRRAGRHDRNMVRQCLESVGIDNLSKEQYRNLSGGQKQRTLIARALATEPHILVLDEPTNGMDLASEHAIMELIRDLHQEGGRTVLMVTHVLNLVANYVERIALLNGKFQIGPAHEILSEANLSSLYGIAVHVREVEGQRLVLSVAGERNAGPAASAAIQGDTRHV